MSFEETAPPSGHPSPPSLQMPGNNQTLINTVSLSLDYFTAIATVIAETLGTTRLMGGADGQMGKAGDRREELTHASYILHWPSPCMYPPLYFFIFYTLHAIAVTVALCC